MQKPFSDNYYSDNQNKKYALVLDIGTSGVKAFVFDDNLNVVVQTDKPLVKHFPHDGWVEQNPEELLETSRDVLREAVTKSGIDGHSFISLGITNQRETTILWDKKSGKPVYPAIVWEDKRTKQECIKWKSQFGETVRTKTGLFVDPYFSASKIWWVLNNVAEAENLLKNHELIFGTVDTWFLWNCLDGNPHFTDYTNASRTLLFNIQTLAWDKELLDLFIIPSEILPSFKPTQYVFGNLKREILDFSLPVLAVCGDQQAGLYAAGQDVGTTKATFGTGSFIMQKIGQSFSLIEPFFTTLTADRQQPNYALEAKLDFYGNKIKSVLFNPEALKFTLTELAKKVDGYLKKLPIQIKNLVIDGGATRDGQLSSIQSEISQIPVRDQVIYDGTALGVAKMLFDK